MFEKLLKALPYNPTLVYQFRFYATRLRREESIRRTGMVFIVLAFVVQFFAVVSPPQATVADSPNDLVVGGFQTKAEAATDCRKDLRHYQEILANYGVSCDDVSNADAVTLRSNDYNDSLYSMGWKPLGDMYNGKKTHEFPADVPNVGTLYWRKLSVWDTGYPVPPYQALHIKGTDYYILYRCGNLVHIGIPKPVPPPKPPKKCDWNPDLLASDKDCHPPFCPQDHSIYVTSDKCKACQWDNTILKSDKQCVQCPNPNHPNVTKSNPKCVPVCPYNDNFDKDSPNCKPCTASVSSQDKLACVRLHKTAKDNTQGWTVSDSTEPTAHAGDTITYTLYAKNGGKADIKKFIMTENVSDVLDYADVTGTNGGTFDLVAGTVTWPATSIKAGQTLQHTITVKVKNPIPQTPVSASDPSRFDLIMTNTYGNTINIKLPGSTTKTVETVAGSLPNTGPGSSLLAGAGIVVVAGYFLARARLLARESLITIRQQATHGGF